MSKLLKEASRLIEADAMVLGEIIRLVARIVSGIGAVGFRLFLGHSASPSEHKL